MTNRLGNRKKVLLKLHGACFYCKTSLINRQLKPHERVPDNFATLDHLDSHWFSLKHVKPEDHPDARTVLCCRKCNQDRNLQELIKTGAKFSGIKKLANDVRRKVKKFLFSLAYKL